MTVFQELDTYLGQEFSVDYWSDEAMLYAYVLVQKMTLTDWEALRTSWQLRPKEWQYRCAEILSSVTGVEDAESLNTTSPFQLSPATFARAFSPGGPTPSCGAGPAPGCTAPRGSV